MNITTPLLLLSIALLASCDSQPTPAPGATAGAGGGAAAPAIETETPTVPAPPLSVTQWGPKTTKAGETFNLQPDGNSGMFFQLSSDAPDAQFTGAVDGKPLSGVVVNGSVVTATVPAAYLSTPGSYPVELAIPSTGVTIPVGSLVVE